MFVNTGRGLYVCAASGGRGQALDCTALKWLLFPSSCPDLCLPTHKGSIRPREMQHGPQTGESGSTHNLGSSGPGSGTVFGAQGSYRSSVIAKSRENEGGRWAELLLSRESELAVRTSGRIKQEHGRWQRREDLETTGYPVSMESPQKTLSIILKTDP